MHNRPCEVCHGTGEIPNPEKGDKQCPYCSGSGMDPFHYNPCIKCEGFGYQRMNKNRIIRAENRNFVNPNRIEQLKSLESTDFDLVKLVQLCRELNTAFSTDCFYSCGMLIRAIVDHCPPIFGFETFKDFSNQYGTKSFKDSMEHLENGSRKLADGYLHEHIRKKESLPTAEQVEYRSQMDKLLSEIIDFLS